MKSTINFLLVSVFSFIIFGCSKNDPVDNTQFDNTFTYRGETYQIGWIQDTIRYVPDSNPEPYSEFGIYVFPSTATFNSVTQEFEGFVGWHLSVSFRNYIGPNPNLTTETLEGLWAIDDNFGITNFNTFYDPNGNRINFELVNSSTIEINRIGDTSEIIIKGSDQNGDVFDFYYKGDFTDYNDNANFPW
jgi:hypothetical protein